MKCQKKKKKSLGSCSKLPHLEQDQLLELQGAVPTSHPHVPLCAAPASTFPR